MHKILCRKCPKCGLFNDFTVITCECGENLWDPTIKVQSIDKLQLSPELVGEIDSSLHAYVQKCPRCGTENFTDSPDRRVTRCYSCSKTQIANVIPIEYADESSAEATPASQEAEKSAPENRTVDRQPSGTHDNDVDTSDPQTALWLKSLMSNIGSSVSQSPMADPAAPPAGSGTVHGGKTQSDNNNDDDEDNDDDIKWFVGGQTSESASRTRSITLTAVTYGQLTFTVSAEQSPYMLGRSANQSDFLSQDTAVGNEHCRLIYQDGKWYVEDYASRNGTLVLSQGVDPKDTAKQDIGRSGMRALTDGDTLKLGHRGDSMAFRITIS